MPYSKRKLAAGLPRARAPQPQCIVSRRRARSQPQKSKLGDVSPEKVQAVEALLTRAREADRVGDQSACEQALAEVRRVLNY